MLAFSAAKILCSCTTLRCIEMGKIEGLIFSLIFPPASDLCSRQTLSFNLRRGYWNQHQRSQRVWYFLWHCHLVHIKHCHLVHIKAIRSQEGATSSSSSDFSFPENWNQDWILKGRALNFLPFPYFCFKKLMNSNLKTHPFCWEPSPAEIFVLAQPSRQISQDPTQYDPI